MPNAYTPANYGPGVSPLGTALSSFGGDFQRARQIEVENQLRRQQQQYEHEIQTNELGLRQQEAGYVPPSTGPMPGSGQLLGAALGQLGGVTGTPGLAVASMLPEPDVVANTPGHYDFGRSLTGAIAGIRNQGLVQSRVEPAQIGAASRQAVATQGIQARADLQAQRLQDADQNLRYRLGGVVQNPDGTMTFQPGAQNYVANQTAQGLATYRQVQAQTARARLQETQRHDLATEGQGAQRIGQGQQRLDRTAPAGGTGLGSLSKAESTLWSGVYKNHFQYNGNAQTAKAAADSAVIESRKAGTPTPIVAPPQGPSLWDRIVHGASDAPKDAPSANALPGGLTSQTKQPLTRQQGGRVVADSDAPQPVIGLPAHPAGPSGNATSRRPLSSAEKQAAQHDPGFQKFLTTKGYSASDWQ